MNKNSLKSSISIAVIAAFTLSLGLSGCAGSKKRAAQESVTQNAKAKNERKSRSGEELPVDITRPPVTIGEERDIVVESNPDETISFEEWKRRQEAAQSKTP